MKNEEFKKLTGKNETRYVLETATAGATSAGAIASAPGALGQVRKRDNILAQEEDHEISMASSQLASTIENATRLLQIVRKYSEKEGLEAWQQAKITKAADYLQAVLTSLKGDELFGKEQGVAEDISRRGLLKGIAGAIGGLGVVGAANQLGKTQNLDAENVTTVNGEKYTLGRPSLGANLDGKTSSGKYKLVKDDKGNIVYIWNDVRTAGGPTRFVKKFIPVDQLSEQGVAEGLDAEAYKEKLLATLPDMMRFFEKNVKGWKPSEEQMLAAVETGYTVMKHTGDVKQAGKAVMDELNTLHRMSQGQQGVAEISDTTKASYKEKAQAQKKELEPYAKKGEYKDFAQRMIARREKGLAKVKEDAYFDQLEEMLGYMLGEKIPPNASVDYYIKDFSKSNAPQFKGKSQEKRRQMAIAAHYASKQPKKKKKK